MGRLDDSVAVAALSLAVVETFRTYRETAPPLSEIRRADSTDYITHQLILDADMLGIILVLAIGGGGAYLSGKWYPLVLSGGALLLVSMYYRSVLRSSNEGMVLANDY